MKIAEDINGKVIYREATQEEIAEADAEVARLAEAEANREPTTDDLFNILFGGI